MPTTSSTAIVEHALLVQSDSSDDAIPVGSPAWYAWLVGATAFAFRSADGTFTAHKERRGPTQEYWKAYRRRAGRLHRVYLGRSEELTLDRLTTVAAELGNKLSAHAQASDAALRDTPAPTDVAKDILKEAPDPGAQAGSFRLRDNRARSATPASAATDDAQSLHLLSTKLAIPASHTRLAPRRRLVSRLDMAIAQGQKLILIAAPAGFGKTTMLAEWLSGADDLAVAWLSLDDADNHLGHFLAYVIAALETVHPRIGTEAWALLRARAAHPPSQAILAILVNALVDHADRIVLVLDDYHAVTLQAIHEALAFLLDRMPAHMHVLITTRADPPLPLARLRGRGQLTELRAADLRFTPDEAAYLFNHIHRIRLSPDVVTTLEARTEGWAAGLQLAALSLQQRDAADMSAFLAGFTGSHTYVFDYLADEVFRRQPAHVRSFLVQTAILGRLCGPLCTAVTGQENAQTLLENLDQANLFLIQLDTNRRWYRYHHLFQEFLRDQLEREMPAIDRALLQRRASVWFEQHGPVGEAIDHALRAEAWSQVLRCLTPIMVTERFYDYYLEWPGWLAALSDAVLEADLTFCLRFAWVLLLTGHIEAAERPLGLAEAGWNAVGNQPKLGEVLGIRSISFYFRGDFLEAMRLAQQALAVLPPDMVEQRGIPIYILGMSDLFRGQVRSAHDFNNLLTVILGNTDMLLEECGGDHPFQHDIAQIRAAADRAAALTRQLLAFSRKQVLIPSIVDLNAVVAGIAPLLKRLIGEHITLSTNLAHDLGRVLADPGQLEQVIVNLVVNARDAMPEGGTLILETANVVLDAPAPGAYVLLAVSDTGIGMDAATRERIFEPFFTTKELGKGTGLGLATVYGIITQSGGHIWVYSEVGQGTTFKVYLPHCDAPDQAIEEYVAEVGAAIAPGNTTILLVEDDAGVRDLTDRLLRGWGYQVLVASDAQDALRIAAESPDPIDLLLTDVIMPGGTNGVALAAQLLVASPTLQVLYMSGYTDMALTSQAVLTAGQTLIMKPFTAEVLARAVRAALAPVDMQPPALQARAAGA